MKPEDLTEKYDVLFGRPLANYPQVGKALGCKAAGELVCQFLYWSGKERNSDGWIYKSYSEIRDEIFLSERDIDTARKVLRDFGILQEKRKVVLYFKFDWNRLLSILEDYLSKGQTSSFEDNRTQRPIKDKGQTSSIKSTNVLDTSTIVLKQSTNVLDTENNIENNKENNIEDINTVVDSTTVEPPPKKKKIEKIFLISDGAGEICDCAVISKSFVELFNGWYEGVGRAKDDPNVIRMMVEKGGVHFSALRHVFKYLSIRGRKRGEFAVEVESLSSLRAKFTRLCAEIDRKERESEPPKLKFQAPYWNGRLDLDDIF